VQQKSSTTAGPAFEAKPDQSNIVKSMISVLFRDEIQGADAIEKTAWMRND